MAGGYKFLVIDSGGLAVDMARRLGQEGHKVWYFCPWQSAETVYAKFEAYAPGVGVPEIEKVMDWAPYADQADCICFFYVGMGELADWLRHKGYVVFGAGKGEAMEQDRAYSTRVMEKLGIKYPKTYDVKGVPQALEVLGTLLNQKTETNQNATGGAFVKFNIFRGTVEAFPAATMEEAEFMFDSVKSSLGPYANSVPMVIQETVNGIETGADLFFDGDKFLMPGMWGFESGGDYIGYVTDDMGIFKNDLDRAAKYMRSVNYRGPFSFECFFDGSSCSWIDWTCRMPMPLGLLYPTFIPDFGKFVIEVATGNSERSPMPEGEYLACMQLNSEEAVSRYLPLAGGKNTKFMRYMMQDGKPYSVPAISILGISSAKGDSLAECKPGIKKEVEDLSVFYGSFNKNFIDDIQETYVGPMADLGVKFGHMESPVVKKENKNLESLDKDFDRWGIPE